MQGDLIKKVADTFFTLYQSQEGSLDLLENNDRKVEFLCEKAHTCYEHSVNSNFYFDNSESYEDDDIEFLSRFHCLDVYLIEKSDECFANTGIRANHFVIEFGYVETRAGLYIVVTANYKGNRVATVLQCPLDIINFSENESYC